MLYPTTPQTVRRRRLIALGAAVCLLLAAVITYAVLVHRSSTATSVPSQRAAAEPLPGRATDGTSASIHLPALPQTSDPQAFARLVAKAIFGWDTASLIVRSDHVELLVAVADPTGESTPGLVADLNNYLPTQDAWVELARYETRQWFRVGSAITPSKWARAKAQAGDTLLPGTTAFTIHGTRHRAGIWEGQPVSSEHDVAFTVFIVCGPSYPACHLLRLSILDQPLD
jgi:hypothetical protein